MQAAPNAALLIDFDNVTMGIRSDLTKELRNLLNSAIIKGKVAVQRAYADWRRYPQYIVPLSEASIDLIFAPAYGSTKKNATDIRLAIDALELVFTRPEIGTFILLSGDSDFSSMVLKLKEYGKYVIGVGIRESSSDLLVQNCDEYYSYSALTGLTRAGDEAVETEDPWVLVERSIRQMVDQGDVMRSDRLKQVMLELDPSFDEKGLGFSKYNRFLTEAASRGCIALKKMENGQYEVGPPEAGGRVEPDRSRGEPDRGRGRGRGERGGRESRAVRESREEKPAEPRRDRAREAPPTAMPAGKAEESTTADGGRAKTAAPGSIDEAYELLRRAVGGLAGERGSSVRDSDVKRRMLEMRPEWDESQYGFPKFSRFLRQAHDAEVIDLRRGEDGAYEVELRGAAPPKEEEPSRSQRSSRSREPRDRGEAEGAEAASGGNGRGRGRERSGGRGRRDRREEAEVSRPVESVEAVRSESPEGESPEVAETARAEEPPAREQTAAEAPAETRGEAAAAERASRRGVLPYRRGRSGPAQGPPPVLPGQAVALRGGVAGADGGERAAEEPPRDRPSEPARDLPPEQAGDSAGEGPQNAAATHSASGDIEELGLPTDRESVLNYLQNSYKGVGKKTAESLIDSLGAANVFTTLQRDPERVREVLGAGRRTDALIEGWEVDYRRRTSRQEEPRKDGAAGGQSVTGPASGGSEGAAAGDSSAGGPASSRRRSRGGRGRGGRGGSARPGGGAD